MRMPAAVAFGSGHEVGDRNKMELVSVVDDDNLLMSRDDERKFLRRLKAEATTTPRGDDDKLIIIVLYYYANRSGLVRPIKQHNLPHPSLIGQG